MKGDLSMRYKRVNVVYRMVLCGRVFAMRTEVIADSDEDSGTVAADLIDFYNRTPLFKGGKRDCDLLYYD